MTNWTERAANIQIGDTICFRTSHLFARGLMRTKLPHLSGTVAGIDGDEARIAWHSPHDQASVPISQLIRLPERGIIE